MEQNQTKTKYTNEFKQQILEVYQSGAYESAAICADAYGVKRSTIYQ